MQRFLRDRAHDRAHETITAFREGLHEPGMLGIIFKNRPDLSNTVVQSLIEVNDSLVRPDVLLNLLSADYLSWVRGQEGEDLEWLGWEPYRDSGFTEFSALEVNLELREANVALSLDTHNDLVQTIVGWAHYVQHATESPALFPTRRPTPFPSAA